MLNISVQELADLLSQYGYWAVLVFVGLESTGIPFPGESMLVGAAIYAGTTHHLAIAGVIAAAAAGAILGDNLGYTLGWLGGFRLLSRFGWLVRLNMRRLKIGQYLFRTHGGKVVFYGRFFVVLRTWAAFLAGTNHMPRWRFFLFNAAGGILWAALYGVAGYLLGDNVHRLTGPFGIVTAVLGVGILVAIFIYVRRNERRLEELAEAAIPGPLSER